MQRRQISEFDRVAQVAGEVTGKLEEKVDERREQAAAGIKSAAGLLRKRVNHGGVAAQASEKLAESMERAADYLHKPKKKHIFGRVRSYVRKHPKRSILGAVLLVFIVGRIIT